MAASFGRFSCLPMDHALNLPISGFVRFYAQPYQIDLLSVDSFPPFVRDEKKKVDKLQTPVNTTDVLLSGNESRFTMLIPCITASSAWLMLWQLGLTFNDKLSTLYTLGSNAAHRNSSPASERQMEEMPRSFKWTSLTLVAANHWQMIR